MKLLKYLLLILIPIALIYIGLCFLGPKELDVTRETTINAPPSSIYNLINTLPNWEKWMPWVEQDSTMKMTYGEKTEGVGASYSWTSENMGNGTVKIVESVKNKSMKTDLIFDGRGGSHGIWDIKRTDEGTLVSWGMQSDEEINFFQRGIMFAMGFKGTMEKNFDDGLANIKALAENRKKGIYGGYEIKSVNIPEKNYILSRAKIHPENISQFNALNLGTMFNKIHGTEIELDGKPSTLYFKMNDSSQLMDLATGIPVKEIMAINGTTNLTIPAKQAVQIDYYGDTKDIDVAHDALKNYIQDKGLLSDVPIIEEYVTDPTKQEDPTKWLTRIIYYLAN